MRIPFALRSSSNLSTHMFSSELNFHITSSFHNRISYENKTGKLWKGDDVHFKKSKNVAGHIFGGA